MHPLTKKYQPMYCREIVGQNAAVRELRDFVVNFKSKRKKSALVYGPSGVGKTCSVYAIARELNYEVIEVNASDFRNKERIGYVVGNAIQQRSLFSQGKIILIDEIDGLSGENDRGCVQALSGLIAESPYPVIMTAMNPYTKKLSSVRNKANMIKFESLDSNSIFNVLRHICDKENIMYDEGTLKFLSRKCGGDLRAAINDAQIAEGRITEESLQTLSDRNKVESILNALLRIFKTTDAEVARDALQNTEEDTNEVFYWLSENLPKEYTKAEDLAAAYNMLSRADVYRGRIRRWQHWRFLSYINILITSGIATSKKEKNRNIVQYSKGTKGLKIFWARQKNMAKKAVAGKLAEKTHCSSNRAIKEIPYFSHIFKNNREMASAIARELKLDKGEIDWLKK